MQLFATELGAWAVLGTFLMAFASAVGWLVQVRKMPQVNLREALDDRVAVEQAQEARIRSLEAEIQRLTVLAEDSRRDSFNTSVLCEKLKVENVRLGMKILDQQEEIDTLRLQVAEHERVAQSRRDTDDIRRGERGH